MALIPGILRTMQHYKAEKERLYEKNKGEDEKPMSFGPGLTFDEEDAVTRSIISDTRPPARPRIPVPKTGASDPFNQQK